MVTIATVDPIDHEAARDDANLPWPTDQDHLVADACEKAAASLTGCP